MRGWHLPDDEEVKAARVAQSLDENKEPTPTPLQELLRQAAQMASPMPPWPGLPAPMPGPPPGWVGTTPVGIVTPTTTDPALTQFPFGKTTC